MSAHGCLLSIRHLLVGLIANQECLPLILSSISGCVVFPEELITHSNPVLLLERAHADLT